MDQQPRPFKIPESVLVVIHTPQREVLLIERTDSAGFWQSVTGSKDHPDESLTLTAAREVWEETGFECGESTPLYGCLRPWGVINEYDIYPRYLHRYAPGVLRNREHLFGLRLPKALTPVLSPREHTAWRWLPWREAADACYSPSNAEAILLLPQFME